jgi:hypothetical protein
MAFEDRNHTPDGRVIVPMGEISYFSLTGTAITVSSQSDGATNLVKAVVATAAPVAANNYEFDNGGSNNGRLRYIGAATRHFHIAVTFSVTPALANDVFVYAIAKNGTIVSESRALMRLGGATAESTALHAMVELGQNDYVEMYLGNTTGERNGTVNTLNMFAMGM